MHARPLALRLALASAHILAGPLVLVPLLGATAHAQDLDDLDNLEDLDTDDVLEPPPPPSRSRPPPPEPAPPARPSRPAPGESVPPPSRPPSRPSRPAAPPPEVETFAPDGYDPAAADSIPDASYSSQPDVPPDAAPDVYTPPDAEPTGDELGNAPAASGGAARVGLVVFPGNTPSAPASLIVEEIARGHFARNPAFAVVSTEAVARGEVPVRALERLERGREALLRGQAAYDALDLEAAVAALRDALRHFDEAAPYLGRGDELIAALIYLGASLLLNGDADGSGDAFARAILFDPSLNLTSDRFPPSMVDQFEQTRARVAAFPQGSLSIATEPSPARVYVDGVFRGVSPLQIDGLPQGPHYVAVERSGWLTGGARVDVKGAREEKVALTLPGAVEQIRYDRLVKGVSGELEAESAGQSTRELLSWLGAQLVVVTKVGHRGSDVELTAVMAEARSGRIVGRGAATLNIKDATFAGKADAFFGKLYASLGVRPPEPPAEGLAVAGMLGGGGASATAHGCLTDSDCGSGETCDAASGRCVPRGERAGVSGAWWFWPAVIGGGVVAAGAIGGGIYLLGSGGGESGPPTGRVELEF